MNRQATISPPLPCERIRMSGVDWRTYCRLLRVFEERPVWRLTYDRGELEIMSPSLVHDKDGRFLGRLVITLTEELSLPIIDGGSVTMRRRRKLRGIEADDCFWIANAARMAGCQKLDLRIYPPPDLAIEADVTNSSMDRMGIYQALRVPEVWRLEGDILTFNVLDSAGRYDAAATSQTFSWVKPADILPFVQQNRQSTDQNAVGRASGFASTGRRRIPEPLMRPVASWLCATGGRPLP